MTRPSKTEIETESGRLTLPEDYRTVMEGAGKAQLESERRVDGFQSFKTDAAAITEQPGGIFEVRISNHEAREISELRGVHDINSAAALARSFGLTVTFPDP